MTLEEFFLIAESSKMAAQLNHAQGLDSFLRLIWRSSEIQEAHSLVASDADAAVALVDRLARLSSFDVDPRHENPYDVPMAIYLWLLLDTAPSLVSTASIVAQRAQNLWWTRLVVRRWSPAARHHTARAEIGPDPTGVPFEGSPDTYGAVNFSKGGFQSRFLPRSAHQSRAGMTSTVSVVVGERVAGKSTDTGVATEEVTE